MGLERSRTPTRCLLEQYTRGRAEWVRSSMCTQKPPWGVGSGAYGYNQRVGMTDTKGTGQNGPTRPQRKESTRTHETSARTPMQPSMVHPCGTEHRAKLGQGWARTHETQRQPQHRRTGAGLEQQCGKVRRWCRYQPDRPPYRMPYPDPRLYRYP